MLAWINAALLTMTTTKTTKKDSTLPTWSTGHQEHAQTWKALNNKHENLEQVM